MRAAAGAAALFLCLAAGAAAPTAVAGDRGMLVALQRYLPLAQAAARGGPEVAQARYDAARTLEEALLAARPVGAGCRRVYEAGLAYARGEVLAAEGVDLGVAAYVSRGTARAKAAARTLRGANLRCKPLTASRPLADPAPASPLPGDVVVGRLAVRVHVPARVDRAAAVLDGREVARLRVSRRVAAGSVTATPGRHAVAIRLYAGRRLVRTAVAQDVWVLPASARLARSPRVRDRALDAKLARIARKFSGYSGIWVHDLATGRVAGWNEEARFPAASTVKLGALVAGLRQFGPRPERSRIAYDLGALTGWSSNLAANHVMTEVGGAPVVEEALHSLGAGSSTFIGPYRVGTALRRGEPPLVSRRVTTARDLGRVLYVLHAGAMGNRAALRRLQMSRHEAEVGLGLLLASRPEGDNVGLLRPALGPGYLMAQKNGWINAARHTAAVLYARDGPVIVVVMTYRGEGMTRARATALGARVLALVRR